MDHDNPFPPVSLRWIINLGHSWRLGMILVLIPVLASCGVRGSTTGSAEVTELPEPAITTIPAPNPEEPVEEFLEAWERGEFPSMYALLSSRARDGLTQEGFAARYESVYRAAALSGVETELLGSELRNPHEARVRYRATLKSVVVGDLNREMSFDLVRERSGWGIEWSEANILPELAGGSGLELTAISPQRGDIFDRNGLPMAEQGVEVLGMYLIPNRLGGEEAESALLSSLRRLFGLASEQAVVDRYDSIRNTDWFVPLGTASLADYQERGGVIGQASGVIVAGPYDSRYYFGRGLTPFFGGSAPHAVGYVSPITVEEQPEYQAAGYGGFENVGRMGVEERFEEELRGTPGGSLYLTDPEGTRLQILAQRDPGQPYNVYTTLDRELQQMVQEALSGFTGAAVVMERDTGRLLALVSSPGYDPNLFDPENPNLRGETLNNLSQAGAYVNRATNGAYPPGSTFKMVTMAAGLDSEVFEPSTIYDCGLEYTEHGGTTLYDWRFEKELPPAGEISLITGLERSCNPWFYHIGYTLFQQDMTSAISDMARAFGFGLATGVEIGDEGGAVPGPDNFDNWTQEEMIQIAIGQGALTVTPLQVARYVAAIGNGGQVLMPYLVDRVESIDGGLAYQGEAQVVSQLALSEEDLQAIQSAMTGVVRDPKATAYRPFNGLRVSLAGKTGTATSGEFSESHAWFAGYTYQGREDRPDIAVAVLLEFAGEGSEMAAPVFRRVIEAYFFDRPLARYPWEERIGVLATPEPEEGEEGEQTTPEP